MSAQPATIEKVIKAAHHENPTSTESSTTISSATSSTTSTSPASTTSDNSSSLKAKSVFSLISRNLNAETVKKVNATYRFDISPDNGNKEQAQSWVILNTETETINYLTLLKNLSIILN